MVDFFWGGGGGDLGFDPFNNDFCCKKFDFTFNSSCKYLDFMFVSKDK